MSVTTILAMAAVGCGGGSGGSNSTSSGSTEGVASFRSSKANDKFVKFGKEASAAEREAASRVLEENFEARAAGDWAGQCASLTKAKIKWLEKAEAYRSVGNTDCATALSYIGEPKSATKAARENTLTGPIDALRIKGDRAWALYHGTGGKNYAAPMKKEGDEWKVNTTTMTELPG